MRRFAGLITVVLLASCGGGGAASGAAGAGGEHDPAGTFGAEQISFGEALAQIRGHHDAAVQLYEDRETDLALVHAGHPIDELLSSVSSELEEHAPEVAEPLSTALDEVKSAIDSGASQADVEAAVEEAAGVTFEAQDGVVGEQAADSDYKGSVIAALLQTAAHEYEEAVAGGKGVSLLEEYQDGYAFVAEARDLYDEIVSDVESASAEEAEEIEEAFDELDAAFPSLEAPKDPEPVEPVEKAAELIGHELEETVDAQLLKSSDPAEIAERINKLLDEILAAYEAGDADGAAELSAEAYLENYEVIEADVIEKAPEINEELEPLLGAELRRQIEAGAPASEIDSMIERARELLADALKAVESH